MINEIFFNGKGSYTDFGGILTYFRVQPPEPRIIKEEVPFMNGYYDFSDLYGETAYSERKIQCKLQFVEENITLMHIKYTKVLEWLLESGKSNLIYTLDPGIYYIARVEKTPSFEAFLSCGVFEFEFIAYPFKFRNFDEGNIPWDDFNFELDCMQDTKFLVIGSKTVELINQSAKKITPTVICTAPFDVIKNGITYKFNIGTTKDWRFNLDKGFNNLTVNGNGNIEFLFRKEVL